MGLLWGVLVCILPHATMLGNTRSHTPITLSEKIFPHNFSLDTLHSLWYSIGKQWERNVWTGKNTTESLWKCQPFPLMGNSTMGHFGIHTTLINTHKWGNMQRDSRRLLLKQRIKSVQLDLDIASSYMDSKDVRKLQDLYMDLHFQMWRLRWVKSYSYLVSPLVLLLYLQVL